MSEKMKEPDIVEIRKRMANLAEIGPWSAIPLSRAEVHALLDELERLRADPPTGWREGIEAAAKVCDEEALESYENSGFNAFNRAAKRILALVPPGDKEKESQDD